MKKSKIVSLVLTFAMLASMVTIPAFAASETATEGHWSDAAMSRWAEVGVFKGDQYGDFMPDKEMTRAEFAQVLVNLMGYTATAENTYVDIPADAWYADAMLKLVAAGVLQGTGYNEAGATASPLDPISREQAAVLLCRALSLKPSADAKINFPDADAVSDWAKDAVAALTERGMLNGTGDGNVSPALVIDRGSVAQMISNMVSEYVTEKGAVITGEQKGIVIVAASEVSFKNAQLAETVVVAPKAVRAEVTLTDSTTAADVVVAAEGATVTVGKSATVASVTLTAPKSAVTVNGTVGTVTVAEAAVNADVTASSGAKIDTVVVAAAGANVDGARNTIGTIVAEATATDITIHASGATLENKTDEKIGSVAPGATGKAPGSVSSVISGGGSYVPSHSGTYSISKDTVVYGSFTVKVGGVEATGANAGETVTITATPAEGYELDTITVTDEDGTEVAVTDGVFTMPAKNVTVKVTFKALPEEPEEPTYSITADAKVYKLTDDTSIDVYVLMNDTEVYTIVDDVKVTEAKAGATVVVTVDNGEVKLIKITTASGGEQTITGSSFTMPAEAVTVTEVRFKAVEAADPTVPDTPADSDTPVDPAKPENQTFDATTLTAASDEEAMGAGELTGFFTISGSVKKRTSSTGGVKAVELAKNKGGSIDFTLDASATVKVVFSSTGSSNTSACGLVDGNGAAVTEDAGLTSVTGSEAGKTTFTYTNLAAGSYKAVCNESGRGARVYTITVEF